MIDSFLLFQICWSSIQIEIWKIIRNESENGFLVRFFLFILCIFSERKKRIFTFHVQEKFKFLLLLLHYNVVCSQCQKPSSISNKIKPKTKNYTQFSLFFPYCSSVMREWGMNGGSWRKFVFLQYDVAYNNTNVAYYNKKEGIAHHRNIVYCLLMYM